MHVGMVLEMAADGLGDRVALGSVDGGLTFADLGHRSRRAATLFTMSAGDHVVLVDENSEAVPLGLFGAAIAGKPFVPLNHRLADDRLRATLERTAPALVIAGAGVPERVDGVAGIEVVAREEFLASVEDESIEEGDGWGCVTESVAVLLFTSGTTGEPRAAVLRNRNLASYVVNSVEFGAAAEDEAAVVCVPPYHIAAVSSVLSNSFAGRRVVQLERFEPDAWVRAVRDERATQAMVVPTMLNRILDFVEADGGGLPSLRSLAYGGGPMPRPVVERALRLLEGVDLVNAYGLTETSSTVAVLGPDDHREAFASDEPAVRARLGSVGRVLRGIELSIRDPSGAPVPDGEMGEIWVRGEQVSGEYLGIGGSGDEGWFNTRDAGRLDADGFLFVAGRLDDVIVRGGENLSPGEIEAVLLDHRAVVAAAVVGVADVAWGERVVAAVVLAPGASATEDELRDHVRAVLRSARTPERIAVRDELPYTETGKLLRRALRDELAAELGA
ncbi:MAG: class I adenylate-forming enzyme family protein [Acidimicrobiales bacterium]